jgi:hypothetical protein
LKKKKKKKRKQRERRKKKAIIPNQIQKALPCLALACKEIETGLPGACDH